MTPNPDPKPTLTHVLAQISFHHAGADHYVRLDSRMYEWSKQIEQYWRGELKRWYPDAVAEVIPARVPITQADIDQLKAEQAGDTEDRWE